MGDGGNDWVFGGNGNDLLKGGEGNNYLDGGTGNDRFIFTTDNGCGSVTTGGDGFDTAVLYSDWSTMSKADVTTMLNAAFAAPDVDGFHYVTGLGWVDGIEKIQITGLSDGTLNYLV